MTATTVHTIDNFHGTYAFLSNFYPAVVLFEGEVYQTTEHAFQAAKTLNLDVRADIREAKSSSQAKRLGRSCVLRDDWNEIRIPTMHGLLEQKFGLTTAGLTTYDISTRNIVLADVLQQRTRCALLLRSTHNAFLVEGNTWNDTFWGICRGVGENNLGKLLMEIRERLHIHARETERT